MNRYKEIEKMIESNEWDIEYHMKKTIHANEVLRALPNDEDMKQTKQYHSERLTKCLFLRDVYHTASDAWFDAGAKEKSYNINSLTNEH